MKERRIKRKEGERERESRENNNFINDATRTRGNIYTTSS